MKYLSFFFRPLLVCFIFVSLIALFFCLPAMAGDEAEELTAKGNGYYREKKYQEAHGYWLQATDLGNAVAAFNLGILYEHGQGVSQNLQEAVKWHQRAADKKYPAAQRNLGVLYRDGRGVRQDYQKAKKLLSLAAGQGDVLGAANLGYMYYAGLGGTDYGLAEKWLRMAAAANNVHGQYYLGLMYEQGKGVPQDDSQAIAWFKPAAEQGIVDAQAKVGMAYLLGDPANKEEGLKWMLAAANSGLPDAQYIMAVFHLGGFGGSKDLEKVLPWLAKAALNNNGQAMADLGTMLMKKLVPQASYGMVRPVFEKWAAGDNASAQIYLAKMKAPVSEGEDLMFTAFTGGATPTYTSVKSALLSLEKVMSAGELQQARASGPRL